MFLDSLPRFPYKFDSSSIYGSYDIVTNVFFRIRIIREVLQEISAYYEYEIKDGDTPEILADKIYGNAEAHWIILLANQIVDPMFDWPMNDTAIGKYLIDKYGSIETAQTTYHGYQKVIVRENVTTGITDTIKLWVDEEQLTDDELSVPYDNWTDLTDVQSVETFNLADGSTVIQTISRARVTNYDYEIELNDAKRSIKIINPRHYNQIIEEFERMTGQSENNRIIRKLV